MTKSKMIRLLSLLAAFLILTLVSFTPIAAQTSTATLSGTVQDENGAVIAGATVSVADLAKGLKREATTNESGSFTFPLLPPSTYTVTVERQGFTPVEVRDVVLNVGDQKSFSVQLKVGSVTGAVDVTPEAALVSTSPAVSTTIDRTFVGNLPLNGRSFQSLILLTPGVVLTRTSGTGNAGQFSVNGQRNNANYFTVDGVSANSGFSTSAASNSQQLAGQVPNLTALGTTSSLVSVDALEEFKIQTSTYSAEFGRQPGGQVQLLTRSGSNDFHGTAFEYLRNEALDANDWFANSAGLGRAPLRQNQFGGTFSGPVILPRFGEGGKAYWSGRNNTFFFFSYEGLRLRLPTTANTFVPSLRLRQIAAPAFQPFLDAYPLPTGPETTDDTGTPSGVAPFLGSYSSPSRMDSTSVRIDHTVNSKVNVFGRYNEAPSNSLSRDLMHLGGAVNSTRALTLGSTSSFNSQLTNEFRFNWSWSRGRDNQSLDNFGGAVPIDLSPLTFGYSGPGVKLGVFLLFLPGIDTQIFLGDQQDSYQKQINVVDNLSWVKGTHQLKFGIDYRRLAPTFGPTAYNAQTIVRNEASLKSGIARSITIIASQGARPRFDNYAFYGQDTWKISPRLTVDLGLRWELDPAPHDADGKKPVVVALKSISDLPTATLAPPDTPFYKTFNTAFAPRVGLSYQLRRRQGQETVLRGGFGVYYDLNGGESTVPFFGYPYTAAKQVRNVPFPISTAAANPPAFPPVTLPITDTVFAFNPNLSLPYTLEWNLAAQQSLGSNQSVTLSYVAAAGRRLLTSQSLNNPPIGAPPANSNFGTIIYGSNGATSDYAAFQAQYQRRLSRRLQALANYTWSHAIDEVSDEVTTGVLDRGNADFDVRHNFSAALSYRIPNPGNSPIIRSLFGNWSADSSIYVQSGQPIDFQAGTMVLSDGARVGVRPDQISGQTFWINDNTAPGGRRLNIAAFANPPTDSSGNFIRQGTLGRNVVRAPGLYQVNLALGRRFNLTERVNLQLKVEAFNLLNHPQFTSYNTNLDSGSFGLATSTLNKTLGGTSELYQLGGSRSIQLSMKLAF